MGVATWTCAHAFPRRSRAVAVVPGATPGCIVIETAGGHALALVAMERAFTHIQWLLAGAPADETAIQYRYHQEFRVTRNEVSDPAFAVLDTRVNREIAGDGTTYSPEASRAAAHRVHATLTGHVPTWRLAEPLGLLALAVREYLSGAEMLRLIREQGHRRKAEGLHTPYLTSARLAYSVSHRDAGEAASPNPTMSLHVACGDPLFTPEVVGHLIDRAQAFADVFSSALHCP